MRLQKLMTNHPDAIGQICFGQVAFAWTMARLMPMAAGAASVHALLPFVIKITASGMMARGNHAMQHRGAKQGEHGHVSLGSL